MTYVIAIPSFNRSVEIQTKTLQFLKNGRINSSIIYIFVANKQEYDIYYKNVPQELYFKLIIGKKGISKQRNYITEYFEEGKNIVSIDDDIEGLYKLKNDGAFLTITDLNHFFIDAFDRLKKEKLKKFGGSMTITEFRENSKMLGRTSNEFLQNCHQIKISYDEIITSKNINKSLENITI